MLQNFIRSFFLGIDNIVYGLLSVIFQLILDLSDFELFSNATIKSFSNRIYLILGLVMIFKLIISFIQILIDPNKMDDKEQGVTGILRRVVISLLLIVFIRPIFTAAKDLQKPLLNVLPRVILAVPVDRTGADGVMYQEGSMLSYYSFLPFFYYINNDCNDGELSFDRSSGKIQSVSDITETILNSKCTSSTDPNGYKYRYQFFISTLVGGFLIYVLVTIALKIAIRAIKFSLCEILAPIPIASYIDPKTSKQSFDKWVETTIKVYIDLFTRLMVVYFIVYIFQLLFVPPNGGASIFQSLIVKYPNDPFRGLLVSLFIIIGLLYFAKEMPKFVSGMLGIPEGFSDIGDMFKGQGWKALGATAGAAAAPLTTALGNYKYARQNGDGRARALLSAAAGGGAALGRGAAAIANKKGFNDSFWNNVATTTGNAHRRANERAIKRQLREENDERNVAYERSISALHNNYTTERNTLRARLNNLMNGDKDYQKRMNILQQKEEGLMNGLTTAEGEVNNARSRVQSAQSARDIAETTLTNARNNHTVSGTNLTAAKNKFDTAQNALTAARDNLNTLNNGLRRAEREYRDAQQFGTELDINAAENRLRIMKNQVDRAQTAFNSAQANVDNERLNLDRAQTAFNNTEALVNRNQMAYDRADANLTAANADLTARQQAYDAAQADYDENHKNLANLLKQYDELMGRIDDVNNQINTIDTREQADLAKLELNKPREINPTRDTLQNALNRAQGLSAVTGSTYVETSQQLSAARSSYYTGEAMKKLKEEGSKVTKVFTLTDGHGHTINATYSDVASALSDLQRGQTPTFNGEPFKGNAADLQELFSLVEKNAAIEYINMVDRGEIRNTTIEEGNKQVAAMLAGLQIDDETRNRLIKDFKADKGKFYKSLSDVSKTLETHGKRLQAYERVKKDKT